MLKVGIMGASGFAGEELIKILLGHPEVKITPINMNETVEFMVKRVS